MKRAHEAPVSIFDTIQNVTDYDYFLVHLFEENPGYWIHAIKAVNSKREVILDNSIFELGTAFEGDRYYYWINRLKPTWFIIPDVLEDYKATISKLDDWFSNYPTPAGMKTIGVIQGKTYDELVNCYKHVAPKVDKVAISFDYSYYKESIDDSITTNKYEKYMLGRIKLINDMLKDNIINTKKPHHLLGCALPQEFKAYKGMRWIDSVDTSNPIVHGINGIIYNENGLDSKVQTKLIEYINSEISSVQLANILYNVEMFKEFTT